MGYGSQALRLLTDFYEGKFTNLSENDTAATEEMIRVTDAELETSNLLSDNVKVRDIHKMPPLFSKLSERKPQPLDYLGVSFGLTPQLHKFWKRASFAPVYLRQTPNELTGEHSCVMLRTLSNSDNDNDSAWLGAFTRDFHKRFLSLLSYQFSAFPSVLALTIIESANAGSKLDLSSPTQPLTYAELNESFSPFDLKRLDSYANNMLDYHVIIDMIPQIAFLYFTHRFSSAGVSLTGVQQSILLAIGLQRKVLEDVEKELGVPSNQLLAMFVKIVRKVSSHFRALVAGTVVQEMPTRPGAREEDGVDMGVPKQKPVQKDLDEELREGGEQVNKELKEKQRALIDALPLDRYEIENGGPGWEEAEKQVQRAMKHKSSNSGVTVSVRSSKPLSAKRKGESAEQVYAEEIGNKEAKRLKKGMMKKAR
ncbi:MAG: hypothetical protein Q9174_007031 [Haloplaca sp. 1 TL-2023]